MKEKNTSNQDTIIQEIVERAQLLLSLMDNPQAFLAAQNELFFQVDMSVFHQERELNQIGLPTSTDQFYQRPAQQLPSLTPHLPRVLNIGAGSEPSRKLAAVNIDLSPQGKPDVIADAQHLPFKSGSFSIVRASHVLEHVQQDELGNTLQEWRRVLHSDGELHVAVPDAQVTFEEIVAGKTHRGQPAVEIKQSTAPLAQVYGLGYNHAETDPRWLHKIIFNQSLLEYFLRAAGFNQVFRRTTQQDLAAYCTITDDSQNHYTLLMTARNERKEHFVDEPLTEKEFDQHVTAFLETHTSFPAASFIIPVQNESKNLHRFLVSLEHTTNKIGANREFIIVLNGCTDHSEAIIRKYAQGSYLPIRIVHSEQGIAHAFEAGIQARQLDGFVGKIDADLMLHPHALDLMQMFLTEHPHLQVTYAEPIPLDSENQYNQPEHYPPLRSERLYIHGRTSLYRTDPFHDTQRSEVLDAIRVEDMFLSFYFAYFYGLESIERTPHACIYSKTVNNYEDLAKQITRSQSEMKRIFALYPPFAVLEKLFDREIYYHQYQDFVHQAHQEKGDETTDWTRIESTK